MREKRRPLGRRSALTVVTDGALILLALLSVMLSVVTAYGLETDLRVLLWGTAGLGALGLLLMSLPRGKVPLTLLSLALWGWGVWERWESLKWGEAAVRCAVVNTIARKMPGVAFITPVMEYPDAVWMELATLWLLMAAAPYALLLSFQICRERRALGAILLTALPILPAVCVTEAPAALPMAGLLAVWMTLLLTSTVNRRDPAGAGRMRPMALGAAALVLALFLQILPTQGTYQPDWAAQLRAEATTASGRLDLSALLSGMGFRGWHGGSGSTEYVSLTGDGVARTGRTVLRVHSSQPGKHYLRGYSAGIYTGERWEPLSRGDQRELEEILAQGEEPLLRLGEYVKEEGGQTQPPWSSVYQPPVQVEKATMEVENVSAPGGCVYYPYALSQVPEGARLAGDSHLEREWRTWEHEVEFYYPEDWYSLYLNAYYWQQAEDDAAEDPYRNFVYEHYLDVPEETRQMLEKWLREAGDYFYWGMSSVEEMARYMKLLQMDGDILTNINLTGNESSATEVLDRLGITVEPEEVEAVRGFYTASVAMSIGEILAEAGSYDVDAPAPPEGEDYVDWFLNESRRGYCMHFATAATLILRTMGIPARYVSGYVVNIPRTGYAVVPDSAAHAWVEIYMDDMGWVPLEVTPGFEGDQVGPNGAESFAPEATPTPAPTPTPTPEPSETPTPSAAPSQAPETEAPEKTGEGSGGSRPIPWQLPAAAALLAVALLVRELALKRRRDKLAEGDTNAAVLCAYRWYQKLKPWGGRENGELTDLANKARFSQHTLTEAERDRAAELLRAEASWVAQGLPGGKKLLFRIWWGRTE